MPTLRDTIRIREIQLDATAAVESERRIPAIISTEYPVARNDYHEVLVHRAAAIDLTRAPLPLLEMHARDRLNIGIVENIHLAGNVLRGEVVLGENDRARELWPDIASGKIRSLSVAYVVLEAQDDGSSVRVTRWQPFEVSLVSVPADPGAGLYRSFTMPHQDTNNTPLPLAGERAAALAEHARISEIQSLAELFGNRIQGIAGMVERAIENGASIAAFRVTLLNALADMDAASGGHFNVAHQPAGMRHHATDFVTAASDALLLRAGVRIQDPHAAANDFRGMSMVDLARCCVDRTGRHSPDDSQQLLARAMGTSDFPAILGGVLWKSLRLGEETELASHRQWCRLTDAPDFRPQHRVILGSMPDLERVPEFGEYREGALSDDKNTLVPGKFGRIVSLSWESILADNLGAFVNLARSFGHATLRVEADSIYNTLISNSLAGPEMTDGVTLFDATRKNIVSVATGTGKPLTAGALGAARAVLRRQTNVGGGLLNLVPRTLLVPPERETEAEILVASSTVHTSSAGADAQAPQWLRSLQVVAEPRLENADTLYLVADSGMIDTAEIALVDGGLAVDELEGQKKRDVLSWRVRHAFAAGFVDFRGILRLTLTA